MTSFSKRCIVLLSALLLAAPALAQGQAQRSYAQPELDQMLAPIALYPDALLSQVLMAATYPLDVVLAARWSRANPGLQGDAAVQAAEIEPWDASVKSLLAFPQVLQRMEENLDWTRALGNAFLAQQPDVMEAVQQLRRRAQAAGNLQSDAQVHVEQQGPAIVVQPASPTVVFVPYYDPMVVYGAWWWPAYRPVAWAPWPGYARPYRQAGFWWGPSVGLSLNFFYGNFDWQHRQVRVLPSGPYYRQQVTVNRTVVVHPRPQAVPQVSEARQMQLRTQQPQARPQVSEARQMQLRTQQVPPRPQLSEARQMQLRQATPPAAVTHRDMRYHPASSEGQGAQAWTRSPSSPAPAAGSARPPHSRS